MGAGMAQDARSPRQRESKPARSGSRPLAGAGSGPLTAAWYVQFNRAVSSAPDVGSSAARELDHGHEEIIDLANRIEKAVEVDWLGDVRVRVQIVAAEYVLLRI